MSTHPREEHDLGLAHDLPRIVERTLGRRGLLALVGGLGAATVAGCAADDSTTSAGSSTGSSAQDVDDTSSTSTGEIPEETAGPYPGDGSNGPDVLSESGVVRSDIRSSFGSASGTAQGVPMTLRLKVHDLSGEDATVLAGAAVYVWHADREGRYSMYDDEIADQNYLRGVQETDEQGLVEFTSVFPACYDGRWPHVHFEVYRDLDAATSGGEKLRTSQLAFPQDTCESVYATEGYEQSVTNLAKVSLDTDMVFSDGYSLQMATMSGSDEEGWTATLNVPV